MSGERRAWGWVAGLRSGETTPWSQWAGEADALGPWLPGAQQLELLRRINVESARRGTRTEPALADRVLAASAVGRGLPDLRLAGAGPEPRFGPRPVDPAELPGRELLRVATGLIAEDLVRSPRPRQRARWSWRRPWAPSYALAGHPWLVRAFAEDLERRGRPQRPDPRRVLVLGDNLESMVRDAWTARAFDEGGGPWLSWIGGLARVDRLPPRVELLAPARAWAQQVGAERVTIVLDRDLLPAALRVRRLAGPPSFGGAAVDLVRRVGMTLGVMVGPEERSVLLREVLGPRLTGTGGPPVGVPDEVRNWLSGRAERMRARLSADGYPVLGDLDRLLGPAPAGTGAGNPPEEDVLALATELLLDPVTEGEGAK